VGYFQDADILQRGPIMNLAGFCKKIKKNNAIAFVVAPERVPIVDVNHKIQGFFFRHYLRIIDLVKDTEAAQGAILAFLDHINSDPDKWNPFLSFYDAELYSHMSKGVAMNDI